MIQPDIVLELHRIEHAERVRRALCRQSLASDADQRHAAARRRWRF